MMERLVQDVCSYIDSETAALLKWLILDSMPVRLPDYMNKRLNDDDDVFTDNILKLHAAVPADRGLTTLLNIFNQELPKAVAERQDKFGLAPGKI